MRDIAPPVPALGDAHAYHVLAENLAHGRGYIRPYDFERLGRTIRTAEYPPVFPAVLAAASLVGLSTIEQQRLADVLRRERHGSVDRVGRPPAGGRTVGLVAAAIAALYPMLFQADAALMPETLAALGGAAVCCWRCGRREEPAGLGGLALGAR